VEIREMLEDLMQELKDIDLYYVGKMETFEFKEGINFEAIEIEEIPQDDIKKILGINK